ncbi:phosphatidylinositol N-acetylglucosaminyltransferase subunit P-like protein [Tanacetum coccineum]
MEKFEDEASFKYDTEEDQPNETHESPPRGSHKPFKVEARIDIPSYDGTVDAEKLDSWLDQLKTYCSEGSTQTGATQSSIIGGLPDDIALMCLARIPRRYHSLLKCVSSKWRDLACSEEWHLYRQKHNLAETWIYALCKDKLEQLCCYSRRTLNYSRNRGATFSILEADNKASGVDVSGEQGPNPSEVYGFVGAISAVVATVIFLVWAYVRDPWLHSIGIFYYPSKYVCTMLMRFALATSVRFLLAVLFAPMKGVLGAGTFMLRHCDSCNNLCILHRPQLYGNSTSDIPNSIFDENSKDPVFPDPTLEEDDRPVEPYSDIGIHWK